MGFVAQFIDVSPLMWIKGEIEQSLIAAKEAINAYKDPSSGKPLLDKSLNALHQVRGATEMVGLNSIARLTYACESLLKLCIEKNTPISLDHSTALFTAFQEIQTYLDHVMETKQDDALSLYPIYRQVMLAQGAKRIPKADLFFPNLSIAIPEREYEKLSPESLKEYLVSYRRTFQANLLLWLKDNKNETAITELQQVTLGVERIQPWEEQKTFWWLAYGFTRVIPSIEADLMPDAKYLCAHIDMVLRRLVNNNTIPIDASVLREALFLIASSEIRKDPVLKTIRRVYGISELQPEMTGDSSVPLGESEIIRVRQEIAMAKEKWDQFSAGAEAELSLFIVQVESLKRIIAPIKHSAITQLAEAIYKAADEAHKDSNKTTDAFMLEMATGILLLEDTLAVYPKLNSEFPAQSDTMVQRLNAVASGQSLDGIADVSLDSYTRQAQERVLMSQLAGEIGRGLRTAETILDGFFRDTTTRSALSDITGALKQIEGALTILQSDEAVSVLKECQQMITGFMRLDDTSGPAEHQTIAQNISALMFYAEELKHGRNDFRAILRKARGLPPEEIPSSSDKEDMDELEVDINTDDVIDLEGDNIQVSLPSQETPPKQAETIRELPPEEIEPEFLDIFLEEAREVVENIHEHIGLLQGAPDNKEYVTVMRRAFHTLKGSGRMVGLMRFGETAWAWEQTLNVWLQENLPVSPPFMEALLEVSNFLSEWLSDLTEEGKSNKEGSAFIATAGGLQQSIGKEFAPPPPKKAEPAKTESIPPLKTASPPEKVDKKQPSHAEDQEKTEQELEEEEDQKPSNLIVIGSLRLSPGLYKIFMDEATHHVSVLEEGAVGIVKGEMSPSQDFIRSAHTMAGIAGTLGFLGLNKLGRVLERALLLAEDVDISSKGGQTLLLEAITAVVDMVSHIRAKKMPPTEDALIVRLDALCEELTALSNKVLPSSLENTMLDRSGLMDILKSSSPPLASKAEVSKTESALDDLFGDTEIATPPQLEVANPQLALDDLFGDSEIYAPPQKASEPHLTSSTKTRQETARSNPESATPINTGEVIASPPKTKEKLPLSPSSPSDTDIAISSLIADVAEKAISTFSEKHSEEKEDRRADRLEDDIDIHLLPIFLEEANELVEQIGEGLRLYALGRNRAEVALQLSRSLHTIKGSARMAGAMGLGHLTHSMESRLEQFQTLSEVPSESIDSLMVSYDRMNSLLDKLRVYRPPPAEKTSAPAPGGTVALPATGAVMAKGGLGGSSLIPSITQKEEASVARAMLRVPAERIDQLVTQAGEVAIARSRIDDELRTLRAALKDLTTNANRLRTQLRQIEIAAETQMQSRVQDLEDKKAGFDPLEFDRFTRFQELTRSMAESVSDVGTIHLGLMKNLDDIDAALISQSRINRELQNDLMKVRMVPFSSVSERLYRITRQTAKGLAKKANLEIVGGQSDIDRSVLERMTGPFEHLLRNAISHGLELPADRLRMGKKEIGEITLMARQEGNEFKLEMRDDGQGINLDRVLAKGIANGLVRKEDNLNESQIIDLIFNSGFSTADEVSEIAGRGVGMDVVRSEISALGGRLDVQSKVGEGTRFLISLPLTLAVTQVILVRTGEHIYALPTAIVGQVRQLNESDVQKADASKSLTWMSDTYPFVYLPRLLGQFYLHPEKQRYTPTVLLISGPNKVAIQVDEIIGSQEVVIKNIGPQLSRVKGVTGATVLGNGSIILIINPLALVSSLIPGRDEQQAVSPTSSPAEQKEPSTLSEPTHQTPQLQASPAPVSPTPTPTAKSISETSSPLYFAERSDTNSRLISSDGKSSPPPSPSAPPPPVAPPAIARHLTGTAPPRKSKQKTVMIVDDSLTVRKITSRLLTRERYQVLTAKDGQDAFEQLQAFELDAQPDVMLVDVEMPRMDGFDLTRNVRADNRLRGIPIIMITSRTADKHKTYAFEVGVNEFLGKPYQEDDLLERISILIKKAEQSLEKTAPV